MSAWTDAALLNAAGIPTVCFGPGDIGVAHAAEEFVPLDEIDRAWTCSRRWCARGARECPP
jgi:acetylornithine deacetylase/succinyl-diaminopimelate desuccinylase-like protein